VTQIEAFTVDAMDACSLTGGGVAILYYQQSTGTVKVAIYNISMVLQTTISFTTGFTGTVCAYYKVTQLTNGKLVVTYQPANSAYSFKIYSTSYALLATVNAPSAAYSQSSISDALNIAPLSGARFVIGTKISSAPNYAVFSDTGTTLVANTQIDSVGYGTNMIAANPSGFTFFGKRDAGTGFFSHFYETTDQSNSFSQTTILNTTTNITSPDLKGVTAVNGSCLFPFLQSSTQTQTLCTQNTRGATSTVSYTYSNNALTVTNTFSSNCLALVGAPCIGGAVTGALDIGARTLQLSYQAGPINASLPSTVTLTFASSDITSSSPSTIIGARLVGLYGNIMVFTYSNLAKYPVYALINVNTASYNTTLVAGATPSNPTQTISLATGYSLVGVSSTAAPANGQGTVVINGPAQLNSNYSESTPGQSFDFGNNVTFGAAGTVSGRNVNLIGNV
jgi:hypothetical protein